MSKEKEEWLPVKDFKGLYEVSNYGNVASLNYRRTGKWHLLSPRPDNWGYLQVTLSKDGKPTTASVHLLVFDAFVGENRAGLEVNHIDEDKNNNAVWNLNLLTRKQNNDWGTHNERVSKANTNHPAISQPTVAKDAEGNIVYEFPSVREAGRNGFNVGAVSAACRGCYHCEGNHKYKGLYWSYME